MIKNYKIKKNWKLFDNHIAEASRQTALHQDSSTQFSSRRSPTRPADRPSAPRWRQERPALRPVHQVVENQSSATDRMRKTSASAYSVLSHKVQKYISVEGDRVAGVSYALYWVPSVYVIISLSKKQVISSRVPCNAARNSEDLALSEKRNLDEPPSCQSTCFLDVCAHQTHLHIVGCSS